MAELDINAVGVSKLAESVARLMGQYEWIVAGSMTDAAKAAKKAVETKILPRIQGGATPWTKRGLMATYATPKRLYSVVGFNYGDGSYSELGFGSKVSGGVPSGRYMQMLAGGGARRPKSTERKLRSAGLIPSNSFITPTGVTPLKLNSKGNIAGPTYNQVLSRLGAASTQGSSQDKSGSKRSSLKRRESDYFVARINGHLGVYARVGKRGKKGGMPRGFHTVFNVTKQPQYSASLPIKQTIWSAYGSAFGVAFKRRLQVELDRRA